ncbi:flagellar hook-length control protein FliK [Tropicimonas sp. IMCC34011]|uniref:flagellar hook-length control protein FliK n=1 Tax=Tropicimonas sp. IMCC34011 TaxID=2248759 RepID=UPI000E24AFFD|nr:flagellar hook-length control protein FliK [Tropicimonas sp. IMCC34011]
MYLALPQTVPSVAPEPSRTTAPDAAKGDSGVSFLLHMMPEVGVPDGEQGALLPDGEALAAGGAPTNDQDVDPDVEAANVAEIVVESGETIAPVDVPSHRGKPEGDEAMDPAQGQPAEDRTRDLRAGAAGAEFAAPPRIEATAETPIPRGTREAAEVPQQPELRSVTSNTPVPGQPFDVSSVDMRAVDARAAEGPRAVTGRVVGGQTSVDRLAVTEDRQVQVRVLADERNAERARAERAPPEEVEDKPSPRAAAPDRLTPQVKVMPQQAFLQLAAVDPGIGAGQAETAAMPAGGGDAGTLQSTSPAGPATAPQTNPAQAQTQAAAITQQIADAARRQPDGRVEIRLDPEELGRVSLTLSRGENGMSVSVVADRQETLDLIRRHSELLARDLAGLGYGSASFDFSGGSTRQGRDDDAPFQTGGALPDGAGAEPAASIRMAPGTGLDLRV